MDILNFVRCNLGEDDMLPKADCPVAVLVKTLLGIQTVKVAHTRERHIDEFVQEIIHPRSPQRDHGPNHHAFSDFKISD